MTWNNYQMITPMELYFEGKTDEEGKLYIDFIEKEARFMEKYEIGMVNCHISCDTIYNVRDKSEQIEFTDKLGKIKTVYLPKSKISTFNDLSRVFNQLSIECKILAHDTGGISELNLLNGKLNISSRLAKCFKIITKSNEISLLSAAINSNVASISKNGSRIIIDGSQFPLNIHSFELPTIASDIVWRFISPYSFQTIFIDSDLTIAEYIGSELANTISVINFDPSSDYIDYQPLRIDWKRINGGVYRKIFIRLADSRGNRLTGVYCSILLKLRKNSFR